MRERILYTAKTIDGFRLGVALKMFSQDQWSAMVAAWSFGEANEHGMFDGRAIRGLIKRGLIDEHGALTDIGRATMKSLAVNR